MDAAWAILDPMDGVDTCVSASYYFLASSYAKATAAYASPTNNSPLPLPLLPAPAPMQNPANNPHATGVFLALPSMNKDAPSAGGDNSKQSLQIGYHLGLINCLVADVPTPPTSISLQRLETLQNPTEGIQLTFTNLRVTEQTALKSCFRQGWFLLQNLISRLGIPATDGIMLSYVREVETKQQQWVLLDERSVRFGDAGHIPISFVILPLARSKRGLLRCWFTRRYLEPPLRVLRPLVALNLYWRMRREEWKDFASSVLLSLPLLVSPNRFEVKLFRCCEYLVSGSFRQSQRVYNTSLVR